MDHLLTFGCALDGRPSIRLAIAQDWDEPHRAPTPYISINRFITGWLQFEPCTAGAIDNRKLGDHQITNRGQHYRRRLRDALGRFGHEDDPFVRSHYLFAA
jgi:hypothetical protein